MIRPLGLVYKKHSGGRIISASIVFPAVEGSLYLYKTFPKAELPPRG